MPRLVAAKVRTLGNVSEDGQDGVADSTQDHDDCGQPRIVTDPGASIFFESNIEDLMRGFDGPVSSDYGEPLLGRQPIGRQTRQEVARLMGWTSATVEAVAVDANHGPQMRPLVGSIGTRQQEDGALDLAQAIAVDSASIRNVDGTIL